MYDVALASRILGKTARAGGMPLYKYLANRAHNDAEKPGLLLMALMFAYSCFGSNSTNLAPKSIVSAGSQSL